MKKIKETLNKAKEYLLSVPRDVINKVPGADVVFFALVLKEIRPYAYGLFEPSCRVEKWFSLFDLWTTYLLLLGVAIYAIRRYMQSRKSS